MNGGMRIMISAMKMDLLGQHHQGLKKLVAGSVGKKLLNNLPSANTHITQVNNKCTKGVLGCLCVSFYTAIYKMNIYIYYICPTFCRRLRVVRLANW